MYIYIYIYIYIAAGRAERCAGGRVQPGPDAKDAILYEELIRHKTNATSRGYMRH